MKKYTDIVEIKIIIENNIEIKTIIENIIEIKIITNCEKRESR